MPSKDEEVPNENLKYIVTTVQDSESILEEANGEINIKTKENMMSPN